jgi:glyoxylase-like metal-dependent hydrolase (beta-lactamase superfamily II)
MSLLLAVALATTAQFRVDRLAEGVYAAVATKPPGLMVQSNTLIVVGDDDVIVVDANLTASATKEVVAAVRKITRKPVRYVVNTHGHDDHVLGNAVYRDAFPGVAFIADPDTRTDIAGVIAGNRKGMLENGPAFVAQIKDALAKGQNLRGEPLTDAERAGLASDVTLAEQYFDETPRTPVFLPTLTFDGTLTFHQGTRTIEIRHVGRGHTRGDVVVWLPEERIVATGDLVIAPIPLVGADQSYVPDWVGALGSVRALRPTIIVPGHGEVMRDGTYLTLMADTLAAATAQAESAIARGETVEQARKSVDLSAFRARFAGDDRWLGFLFDVYVAQPAVGAVYREVAARPGRGP